MRDRHRLPLAAAYVGAYLLLDWVSYIHPIAPYAITPWNPPPGLSLALLLVKGLRYVPAVLVATAIAELAIHGGSAHPAHALLFAIVLSAGYGAIAAVLLRKCRFDAEFRTLRDLALLIAAVAIGAMLVAAVYVAAHVVVGEEPWEQFLEHTVRFWVGDAIGVVTTTPFLLLYRYWPPGREFAGLKLESAVQAGGILLALALIFSLEPAAASKFFYVLFLPLIWVAMRRGIEGAAAALLAIQVGLIVSVQLAGYEAASVFDFQLLMLALAVTGLFLGMAASESRRARDMLAVREAELKTVIQTAPDAIVIADEQHRILAVNPAGEAMFGVPAERLAGTALEAVISTAESDGPEHAHAIETRARRADGSTFPAEVSVARTGSGGRIALIALVRNVSQRHEIEGRLREREAELDRAIRLAAASEMASALAHELNQPLTAAANYVQVCELLLAQGTPGRERLSEALARTSAEVGRSVEVVRRLRDFYRGSSPRRETLALPALAESALGALRGRLQRHAVEALIETAEELAPVTVDRIQIEMVVLNLVANAIDAIAAANCDTRRVTLSMRPGEPGFVEVSVEDTGPGVSPEIVPRLFSTYATSKATGMGLGLAISRSIAEAHGGRLRMDRTGPGARFTLALPAADATEEQA